MKTKFNLGDKLSDKYTSFTGHVHGIARYITGCDQYLLNPRTLNKDGKPEAGEWMDETRLVLETAADVVDVSAEKNPRGGPSAAEISTMRKC